MIFFKFLNANICIESDNFDTQNGNLKFDFSTYAQVFKLESFKTYSNKNIYCA